MAETKEYIIVPEENGSINIAEDVIQTIVTAAALEVDGVAAPSNLAKELLNMKPVSRGVHVVQEETGLKLDVFILVKMGYTISKVAAEVQKAVAAAVESMTGCEVTAVNVTVTGIVLDKDSNN